MKKAKIGERTYIVAEIGSNLSRDIKTTKKLIDVTLIIPCNGLISRLRGGIYK